MVANWPTSGEFLRVIALCERLLVPLSMAWLALRWFWVVRKAPAENITKAEQEQMDKASKATQRAFVGGLLLAVPLVLLGMRVCPPAQADNLSPVDGVLQLGLPSVVAACVAGLAAGMAAWWAGRKAQAWQTEKLGHWRASVILAAGLGVSSLVVYFQYPDYFWPHAWLVWGYMCLFVTSCIAHLLGE